jgi:hypothetical protein
MLTPTCAAVEHGLDHVFSADHVSRDGMGIDGLVQLAWVLGHHPTLRPCGVYLLATPSTVVAARSPSPAGPGPVLGVGVGEDPLLRSGECRRVAGGTPTSPRRARPLG